MSKLLTQKRFIQPQVVEQLPTFRQIPNNLNSIPSASTIYPERDNTHTRMQSELKINFAKPSLDYGRNPSLTIKTEQQSELLDYSETLSLTLIEDSLMQLKKLMNLMSSKQNISNHISQSLAISGFNLQLSKQIGKILAVSFGEYITITQNIQARIIKDQITNKDEKITNCTKQIINLKQQNLNLMKNNMKLEDENGKLKKKIGSIKEKRGNSVNISPLKRIIEQQFAKIIDKITVFECQMYVKLGYFQDSLIKVTDLRNNMLKDIVNNCMWRQQSKKTENENKKLHKIIRTKDHAIERLAYRQQNSADAENNSLQIYTKIINDKNQQLKQLKSLYENVSFQLEQQKRLYQQMLDKNISLQKQIYILSLKNDTEQCKSFTITNNFEQFNDQMAIIEPSLDSFEF